MRVKPHSEPQLPPAALPGSVHGKGQAVAAGHRAPTGRHLREFPKEAGATHPEVWRQKSEFVLKSTRKKAPCWVGRGEREGLAREQVLCEITFRGQRRAVPTLAGGSGVAAYTSSWVFLTPQKEHTQKSHSLKRTGVEGSGRRRGHRHVLELVSGRQHQKSLGRCPHWCGSLDKASG